MSELNDDQLFEELLNLKVEVVSDIDEADLMPVYDEYFSSKVFDSHSEDFEYVEEKSAKKKLKDPKGGLTAAGRAYFNRTEGSNLKPGVKGAADTPEKMRRKGSFLTRFFTNPRGPLKDEKGRPTRKAAALKRWKC
jgi:hypothetical protein